jgi:hypothetical protein
MRPHAAAGATPPAVLALEAVLVALTITGGHAGGRFGHRWNQDARQGADSAPTGTVERSSAQ